MTAITFEIMALGMAMAYVYNNHYLAVLLLLQLAKLELTSALVSSQIFL